MKSVGLSVLAVLGLFAAFMPAWADSQPIDAQNVHSYLEAVLDGGAESLTCQRPVVDGGNFSAAQFDAQLENVSSGSVDTSGGQPALTLIRKMDDQNQVVFFFSTSSDQKRIVQMSVSFQSLKQVNEGTILQPNLQQEFVETQSFTCQ